MALNEALEAHHIRKEDSSRNLFLEGTTRFELHYFVQRIVTTEEDSWDAAQKTIGKLVPEISPATLVDFKLQNQKSRRTIPALELKVPYVGVSEIQGMGENTSGTNTSAPIATVSLSAIGFTKGNEALVHCSILTSEKSGAGYLVLLRNNNGKWSIKSVVVAWRA